MRHGLALRALVLGLLVLSTSAAATSLVTSDPLQVAAFVTNVDGPFGFDEVAGNPSAPGATVAAASAYDDELQGVGLRFSSTGGPCVAVSAPGDAFSDPNLLGGTSLGVGGPVVDYVAPIRIDFVVPGTATARPVSLVGFWNDPTSSIVQLDIYDGTDALIESVQGSEGEFIGIQGAGITYATVSYVTAQSVLGFAIDDLYTNVVSVTTTTTITTTTIVSTTTSSTTTTLAVEQCENCLDDDGDGLADYEDPACCSDASALTILKVSLKPGKGGLGVAKLKMKGSLVPTSFADVNPLGEDVTVQLRDPGGELVCVTLVRSLWKEKGNGFRYKDASGSQSHGLSKVTFKMKKAGLVGFQAASRNIDLAGFTGPSLVATVRAGDRCAGATVALRSKGKGFVYP